jgi:hypothetical protein
MDKENLVVRSEALHEFKSTPLFTSCVTSLQTQFYHFKMNIIIVPAYQGACEHQMSPYTKRS